MHDLRDSVLQQKLNSATKYPETQTYHFMDKKSGLLQEDQPVDFAGKRVQITEKVDGTNARIIIVPARKTSHGSPMFFIGSRENLLNSNMDWVCNRELSIVDVLVGTARKLLRDTRDDDLVRVYFFEVYGGTVGSNAKQYTKSRDIFGHRLFDVIEFDDELFDETMSYGRESIAGWRDRGAQPFVDHDKFFDIAKDAKLLRVPLLSPNFDSGLLPSTLQESQEFMKSFLPDGTMAELDSDFHGRPEGLVIKSLDRSITAKMRFVDYESTIRRNEDQARKAAKLREKDTIVE